LVSLIPLGTAMVAAAFATMLARQYLERRRFYQLIWTAAMVLFAAGAFLEFVMSYVIVTGPLFDLYYLLIGPETGLLGAGVVYLLRPKYGKYTLYAVIALSAGLVLSVAMWPVDLSGLVTGMPGPAMTYQQWFQSNVVYGIAFAVGAFAEVPRDFTMVLNTAGAILVVGGGLLSFVVDRSRYYALLIAAGALMNAIGGILLGILNTPSVFFYFEFFGIMLFFAGFLMSSRFVTKKP
jgi:MFS family permease